MLRDTETFKTDSISYISCSIHNLAPWLPSVRLLRHSGSWPHPLNRTRGTWWSMSVWADCRTFEEHTFKVFSMEIASWTWEILLWYGVCTAGWCSECKQESMTWIYQWSTVLDGCMGDGWILRLGSEVCRLVSSHYGVYMYCPCVCQGKGVICDYMW